MLYYGGLEIFHKEVSLKGRFVPHLSGLDRTTFDALFNQLTDLSEKLNNNPPLLQFFMFSTKNKYKKALKEFLELLSFWSFPKMLLNVVTNTKADVWH